MLPNSMVSRQFPWRSQAVPQLHRQKKEVLNAALNASLFSTAICSNLQISHLPVWVYFHVDWYSLPLILSETPPKPNVDRPVPPSPRTPSGRLKPRCKTCGNYMRGHDKAACDASKSCATPSRTPNTTSPAPTESTQQPIEEEFDVCISLIPKYSLSQSNVWITRLYQTSPQYIPTPIPYWF